MASTSHRSALKLGRPNRPARSHRPSRGSRWRQRGRGTLSPTCTSVRRPLLLLLLLLLVLALLPLLHALTALPTFLLPLLPLFSSTIYTSRLSFTALLHNRRRRTDLDLLSLRLLDAPRRPRAYDLLLERLGHGPLGRRGPPLCDPVARRPRRPAVAPRVCAPGARARRVTRRPRDEVDGGGRDGEAEGDCARARARRVREGERVVGGEEGGG